MVIKWFEKRQTLFPILLNIVKLVVVVVLAVGVISVLSKKIVDIGNSLSEQRTSSYVLEQKTENIALLRNDLEKISEIEKKMDLALPTTDNLIEFRAALASLAKKYQFQESIIAGYPIETGDSYATIAYQITLDSRVDSLIKWLKDFESLPYFALVSEIDIKAKDQNWNGNNEIKLSVVLLTRIPE